MNINNEKLEIVKEENLTKENLNKVVAKIRKFKFLLVSRVIMVYLIYIAIFAFTIKNILVIIILGFLIGFLVNLEIKNIHGHIKIYESSVKLNFSLLKNEK